MRTNGLIHIHTNSETINEWGEIETTETESISLYCFIVTITDTRSGVYEDGTFRNMSFQVLLEDHPALENLDEIKSIRLVRYNQDLGEFRVLRVDRMLSQGRISLWV